MEKSKHAVVTGGSSGIGLAVGKEFARRGVGLSLLARDAEKLARAKAEIEGAFRVVVETQVCDVVDAEGLEAVISGIGAAHGIDFLVCSAGVMQCGRVDENSLESLRRTMEVNYFGALNAYKAGIEVMKAQGSGQIGFVSSVAGYLGAIGYGGYAPGKFALAGLAECVRMEAADYGVGITIAYPPDTDTPMLAWERENTLPECRAISKNAKLQTPEAVAGKLVRAMERNRFEVFFDVNSKFIRFFKVLWPRMYFKSLDGIVRKDRKRRSQNGHA